MLLINVMSAGLEKTLKALKLQPKLLQYSHFFLVNDVNQPYHDFKFQWKQG